MFDHRIEKDCVSDVFDPGTSWTGKCCNLKSSGSARGGGGRCWMREKATQIQLVFRSYCFCLFLILSKFHFGTNEFVWSYWTIVIFRPLKVEIHLNRWPSLEVHQWAAIITFLTTFFCFAVCVLLYIFKALQNKAPNGLHGPYKCC